MAHEVITLEIDAADEHLMRGHADPVGEMKGLAATPPDRSALDVCEDAIVNRGREPQRRLPEQAARSRLDAAEKRRATEGRPCEKAREHRGIDPRDDITCLGPVALRRR